MTTPQLHKDAVDILLDGARYAQKMGERYYGEGFMVEAYQYDSGVSLYIEWASGDADMVAFDNWELARAYLESLIKESAQ